VSTCARSALIAFVVAELALFFGFCHDIHLELGLVLDRVDITPPVLVEDLLLRLAIFVEFLSKTLSADHDSKRAHAGDDRAETDELAIP
jgi:hypothetical protein